MAEKVVDANEMSDVKKRPQCLFENSTPIIKVINSDESDTGTQRARANSIPSTGMFLHPHPEEDQSSGISDQGTSDCDVESAFTPSPNGSYRGSQEYLHGLGCTSDSSTLQSDEDFIEQDITPSPTDPNSPYHKDLLRRRSSSPTPIHKTTLSPWSTVRKAMHAWSPFMQVYRKKYPWVQLAGHQGSFKPGGYYGTVLKKSSEYEQEALRKLMTDEMKPFVPEFKRIVTQEDGTYVEMQDLLRDFDKPAVMDIKMGTRTYLEEELIKANLKPTLRKDMYEKMIAVDRNEPTEEEHAQKAITKPRYMQWRENISSSATLGFRIEGIKKTGTEHPKKNFKNTKTREQVKECLREFIGGNEVIREKVYHRLLDIKSAAENSAFFQTHEIIGSSLLFVYDETGQANVWVIDFGKTVPLPSGVFVDHRSNWVEGNHEDGYLFGLDNLIGLLSDKRDCSLHQASTES